MMDEQRLRDLAATDVTVPAPDDVIDRGEQIRSRRRLARGAAVATLCLAVAAGAVVVAAANRDRTPSVEVAGPDSDLNPGTDASCGGFSEIRPPATVDTLRYLPSWLPEGRKVQYAWATADILARETCPRVPVAFSAGRFTTPSHDRIDGMIQVMGPSPVPFPRASGAFSKPKTVSMRGTAGELVELPGAGPAVQNVRTRWTEPGGDSWQIQSSYLTEAEVLQIVEGLKLTAGFEAPPVSASWLPAGFEVTYQRDRAAGPLPTEARMWHADTGNDSALSLRVQELVPNNPPVSRFIPAPETRIVDVRGHQAVATAIGDSIDLYWEEQPGIAVTIHGAYSLEELMRIAESLEPVAPDDPRIRIRE